MTNVRATAWWSIPLAMACPLACAPIEGPPRIPVGKATVNVTGPVTRIDEIVLERFGHRSAAPYYKVVLSKYGSVTYTGKYNVTKIGTFNAKIRLDDFRRLEEMMDHLRYFEIDDKIFVIDDADSVRTSAVREAGEGRLMTDRAVPHP